MCVCGGGGEEGVGGGCVMNLHDLHGMKTGRDEKGEGVCQGDTETVTVGRERPAWRHTHGTEPRTARHAMHGWTISQGT